MQNMGIDFDTKKLNYLFGTFTQEDSFSIRRFEGLA